MKYIILYLLIGVLMQIILRSILLIGKTVVEDVIKTTDNVFDKDSILDDTDYHQIAYHPLSIVVNVIGWPINLIIMGLYIITLYKQWKKRQ